MCKTSHSCRLPCFLENEGATKSVFHLYLTILLQLLIALLLKKILYERSSIISFFKKEAL
jgi:hypothetical protein